MKPHLIAAAALAAAAFAQPAAAFGPAAATHLKPAGHTFTQASYNPRLAQLRARPQAAREDCVSFNNRTVQLKRINGRWKIVDGNHWIADFGGNAREAKQAFRIVKFYGFNKQCFVGRPGPSMTYWKRGNGIPGNDMRGQDCVSFNPRTVQVKRINGRWKIVDGNHWIADFGGNRKEAFEAFGIVKRYRLSKQCFVGRPGPSMTYWLR
jgi:hypothetical protein